MANDSRSLRSSLRIENLREALEHKLEDEGAVIDVLLGAAARGDVDASLWGALHDAARRDDRLAELAFTYERLASDRRMRTLPPAAQAEVWVLVGAFFAEVFGDSDGAIGAFERALAARAGHTEALARLDAVLAARGETLRRSELFAQSASHRGDRAEQVAALRRALELLDEVDVEPERVVKLGQQILRLEPGDAVVRRKLEGVYAAAGRHAELARMLEQALGADPPPAGDELVEIRSYLVALYARELREVERALPHLEELLRIMPGHGLSISVAEELLGHKAVAARAAAALEGAYQAAGRVDDQARMLAMAVEQLRGPKRLDAQRKLAALRRAQGNAAGACVLYEQIVPADPADDESREAYRALSAELGKSKDAARVLGRALTGAKDPALRARIGVAIAEELVASGDERRAKSTFKDVLEAAADDGAVLRAARAVLPLAEKDKDARLVAAALDKLASLEQVEDARVEAARRLAALCEHELADPERAATAYRRLEGTRFEREALEALVRIHEAASAHDALAQALERLAAIEEDRTAARAHAFRAAEIRATKGGDRAAALEALARVAATWGPARDVHARALPLLEQDKRFEDLAAMLEADAALAPDEERAAVLARLANVRLARLGDPAGALDAFRRALAIDPSDRASRLAVDKLLAAGDLRLAAADVLEPIVRAEGSAQGLVRVLEARAELTEDPRARLAALDEASRVAETGLRDPARALDLAGRGLALAATVARDALPSWVERLDALPPTSGDLARRAALLAAALGEHAVDDPATFALAERAAHALELLGDVAQALAIYRRALAFAPSSPELLERVDALLRETGSPEERLALHRAALESARTPARRREILHAIGAIQRRDLCDPAAAIATFRAALAEDASDAHAFEAILDAYEALGDDASLFAELERGLERAEGASRAALLLRLARLAASRGDAARAAGAYREILALRDDADLLVEAEAFADKSGDASFLAEVLARRVRLGLDADAELALQERLGELYAGPLADAEHASAALRRAAELAEAAGDPLRAERLFERVAALGGEDREVLERLVGMYERRGAWDRLPSAVGALLAHVGEDAATDRVLALEPLAIEARSRADEGASRAIDAFGELVSAVLAAHPEARRKGALLAARARALASDPTRTDDAAAAYRAWLEAAGDAWSAPAEAFSAFLDAHPERRDDRRALFALRAEREEDAVPVLLAWAAREQAWGELARAAEVHARVLAMDPENDEALAARTRLLRELGDLEGAAATLVARRDRAEGSARLALDRELATLLADDLGRPGEALDAVASVLDAAPGDATALRIAASALADPTSRTRAAELLEHAESVLEDAGDRVALLERLLEGTRDQDELRDARRGWFERLLDLHEGKAEAAFAIALRAVRELPEAEALWDRADALARTLESPRPVAEAYRAALADPPPALSGDALDAVARRAVDLQEEWFDEPEVVVGLLSRAIALAPTATWAFDRLKLVYNASERWDDLLALYDGALARTTDPEERVLVLEDAAQIARDFAGAPERAVRYLEEWLHLRPRDARVQSSLERLYERTGQHAPLIALLESTMDALDDEARLQRKLRVATLWVDGVHDPARGLDAVLDVLARDPERAEVFPLVERALEDGAASSETRARAATLLETRHRAASSWADLARVLGVLAEVGDPAMRAARLRERAALREERLGDPAGALDDVAALLALDPAEAELRAELARLAEKTGRHDRRAEVLSAIAERAEGGALRAELEAEAAALHDERLGDPAGAIALYQRVAAASEAPAARVLAALRELDRLLASTGQEGTRCDVLERLGDREEPERARAALAEAARIARHVLGDPARAVRALERVLAIEPGDRAALDALVDALRDLGAHRELVAALGRRARVADPAAARRDRMEAARLLADTLDDVEAAIAEARAVVADLGADDEAADTIGALLERAGRDEELVAHYEREAEAAADPVRRAALWRRAGAFHRNKGALDLATISYEAALAAVPDDAESLAGLEAVLEAARAGDPAQLAAVVAALRDAYVQIGDHAGLARLLDPRLAVATSDDERARVLLETAELCADEPERALELSLRAFTLDPTSEVAARAVDRAAERSAQWDRVEQALAEIEARIEVPAAIARDLHHRVGVWHRDAREDAAAADAAFERAIARAPEDQAILAALADVRRREGGARLVDVLLRLARVTGDEVSAREAAEAALRGGDRARAVAVAREVFERAAAAIDAVAGADAALEHARWALEFVADRSETGPEIEAAVGLLSSGARLPFPAEERRALRLRASGLADPEGALAIAEALFEEDPRDEEAAARMEKAYRGAGRLRDVVRLRERQADAAEGERRVALRLDAAVLLAELGERDAAIAALRDNLATSPGHRASAERLAVLYEAAGAAPELVALWESQAALHETAGDRASAADAFARAAAVAESAIGDVPRAIRALRRAAACGATASLDRLAELHASRGEHAAAADALERLVAADPDAAIAARALRLADAYVAAGEDAAARATLERAAARAPADAAPVRERLEHVYRAAEAWEPLAALVTAEAEAARDRATRLAKLREAAAIHLEQRGDAARAIPLLEQAAALAPEDGAIRLAVADAFGAAGRIDEGMGLLRAMIEGYGTRRPKERALVHHGIARLSLAVGDRASALRELDAASRIDPAHPAIVLALARLALEEGQLERAERSFRALLLLLRGKRREGEGPSVGRAEVLLELGAIAERQGDPARAEELVESAFEEARGSDAEMAELVRALRARKSHAALARALEIRAGALRDPAAASAALRELAAVADEHLGRPEVALDALLRAVALRPDALALHEAALAAARKCDRVASYLAALSDLEARCTDSRRAARLSISRGAAIEATSDDAAAARAAYERAEELLVAEGTDPPPQELLTAWRALERLAQAAGDARAEAAVIERRLAATPNAKPDERAGALYRLASLRAGEGADLGALLEDAVALDPDPARALRELWAAADRARDPEPVLRLAERVARDTNDRRALVDALVRLAAHEGPSRLWEAASTARELEDAALAESILRRILAEDASGSRASAAMIALADLRAAAGDLAEAADLKEKAASLSEPVDERALLLDVAALASGPLGDPERAARLYEVLREREPADREIWSPLADLYRCVGDSSRLAALLDATVPLVDVLEERSRLRLERAGIAAESDPEAAMALLREILDDDPAQVEAAMRLSRMLEERGRTEELADLLARQLDGAKDREDVASIGSLSLRLGALLEAREDIHGALDVYEGALRWDESSRDLLRAVVRIALAREDSIQLGDALDRLLAVETGAEAEELALRLAEIRAAQGDDAGAEQALATGYAAHPASERLRDELIRRYDARGAFRELADVYLADASVRKTVEEQVGSLCVAAEILREREGDPAAAAEVLRKALDVDPANRDVLLALLDAFAAAGQHDRAIEAVSRVIESAPEDAWLYRSRAALHDAAGRLDLALADLETAHAKSPGTYTHELATVLDVAIQTGVPGRSPRDLRLELAEVLATSGDVDRARAMLAELVRLDPRDKGALRRLATLEEGAERWDAASGTLRRLLALEDGDAFVRTALELADACEKSGRPADAQAGLERAHAIAKADATVRARLRHLYELTSASRELARLVLEEAAEAADVAAKHAHLVHAGRLLLDAEDGATEAIAVLEEARGLRPEDHDTAVLLADAFAAGARLADASALLSEAIAAHRGRRSKQVGALHERLASIAEHEGRHADALASLAKAFESDPQNATVAGRFGALAYALGDRDASARAFRSLTLMKPASAATPDGATPEVKSIAFVYLARIAADQGDRRKAKLMAEKALAEDPSQEAARALLDEVK